MNDFDDDDVLVGESLVIRNEEHRLMVREDLKSTGRDELIKKHCYKATD